MAGTLFENNLSPYLTLVEGSTPASPSAGDDRLFVDSSDHLLKWVNSSGAVTPVAKNPMTAAQDLIVGGASGIPSRLAVGIAGAVLGVSAGAVTYLAGTSFPGSPTTNDVYYRTDLGLWFSWNGTYWLSVQQFWTDIGVVGVVAWPLAATAGGTHRAVAPGLFGGADVYLTTLATAFNVSGGTALGASHNWVGTLNKTQGVTSSGIATVTINSGSSSTWRTDSQAINALMNGGTAEMEVDMGWVKTGTPGSLYVVHRLMYRIRAT